MNHLTRAGLAAALLVGGCTKASPSAPAPATAASETSDELADSLRIPQLRDREALPDEAREMLHGQMRRHGDQLIYLVTSVLLLDYGSTARLADNLAEEPRLGRPAKGETDTLNALLPVAFFKYQDALTKHARELGKAARATDDAALGEAFAAVTKTCVGCHAAYLDDDLGFPLHDESDAPHGDLCDADDPECSGLGTDGRLRSRRGSAF